jgi:hypothetical protein
MKEYVMTNKAEERRYQPIKQVDQYYSVEFSLSGCAFVYQFKIRKVSLKEICVLVREDSDLLNYLKVGDILNLKYYTTNSFRPVEYLKTEIRYISKNDKERLRGLCMVGLLILENKNFYN